MTKSGYPRVIKRWVRGTSLTSATTVYEAKESDVRAYAMSSHAKGHKWVMVGRSIDFYNDEQFFLEGDRLVKIDKPTDASFTPYRHWATITLRSDWSVGQASYKAGALLVTQLSDYLAGKRAFTVLFEPSATTSLSGYDFTRSHLLVNTMDNVKSRLMEWSEIKGQWSSRVVKLPQNGELSIDSLYDSSLENDPLGDKYVISYHDFLTPDSLMLGHAGSDARELLKQLPQRFDSTGMSDQLQSIPERKSWSQIPTHIL